MRSCGDADSHLECAQAGDGALAVKGVIRTPAAALPSAPKPAARIAGREGSMAAERLDLVDYRLSVSGETDLSPTSGPEHLAVR